MMKRRLLALFGTAALAVQPQLAAAQAPCLGEDEVSAAAIYAVPSLVRSVQLACANQVSPSGFLLREGDAMAARYVTLQGRAWPEAKAALLKIAGSGAAGDAGEGLDMIASLPDESVRPLVDAMIVQEVSGEIKPAQCGRIERVIEAVAPIEPAVAGRLLGVVVGLVAEDQPLVCPAPAG